MNQALLHQLFDLAETGDLIWKRPAIPQIKVGTVAGRRRCGSGRVLIRIRGQDYSRAHLVYQYVYGGPLPSEVFHINGDPADDRPENLHEVTTSQRNMSKIAGRFGRDLPKGVSQHKWVKTNPFYARIKVSGKTVHLGYFATPEGAAAAYDAAAKNLFGEFAGPNYL